MAGFLAGKVMSGKGYGIVVDILLGLAGGWLGAFLGGFLHIPSFGYFVTAFLGLNLARNFKRYLVMMNAFGKTQWFCGLRRTRLLTFVCIKHKPWFSLIIY